MRMVTLAQWIYMVFTTEEMMSMLGVSTLEWKNRCIVMQCNPLPWPGSSLLESYSMKHGLATLLAADNVGDVVHACNSVQRTPPMYQVVNCIMSAMVNHVNDTPQLRTLAEGFLYYTLHNEDEMKLIMPPAFALLIPTIGISAGRILHLLSQSHRFVIVHHSTTFYWLKSFLGYLLLLLRSEGLELPEAIDFLLRNRATMWPDQLWPDGEVRHSAAIKGMMLMQALDEQFTLTILDLTETPGRRVVPDIHIKLVLMLLCMMDANPIACISEGLMWLSHHPKGVQMARNKAMRPIMRLALTSCRPILPHIHLLSNLIILRFLVRISRHISLATDCILGQDPSQWTPEAIQIVCNDGYLLDLIAWQLMFNPCMPSPVVQCLLEDQRYNQREWYVPLRMHVCMRSTRPAPRHAGPLQRLVCAGDMQANDINDSIQYFVFHGTEVLVGLPPPTSIAFRWWRAGTAHDPCTTTKGDLINAWLLRRIRIYVQTVILDVAGAPPLPNLSTALELMFINALKGYPNTMCVGESIWFLVQCGSPQALLTGIARWILEHRFSWVSVAQDASEGALQSLLPRMEERGRESTEVLQVIAPLYLVVASTVR